MADLSQMQYLKKYVHVKASPLVGGTYDSSFLIEPDEKVVGSNHTFDDSIPDKWDWRELGFKIPKEQKQCGSCYAFAVTSSIEGQVFKRTGKLIRLSEQQIIDCSTVNLGCNGGFSRDTLRYVTSTKGGLMREKDYPYMASVIGLQFSSF